MKTHNRRLLAGSNIEPLSAFHHRRRKSVDQPYIDYGIIEVFDFKQHWDMVKPFLHDPEVEKALADAVNNYCLSRAAACEAEGLNPEHWLRGYDPEAGPWCHDSTDYWDDRAIEMAQEAIDSGKAEFQWSENQDEEPDEEELQRYADFVGQFYPHPDTYEWYQLRLGADFLAPWLKMLGERAFPDLRWKVLEHSLAVGMDDDGRIKLIFDIVDFDTMSAEQLLEIATT